MSQCSSHKRTSQKNSRQPSVVACALLAAAGLAGLALLCDPSAASAGSTTHINGGSGGTGGGSHTGGNTGGKSGHSGGSASHSGSKTPKLAAPVPHIIVLHANSQANGLTRYRDIAASSRNTAAPLQSRPVLHPLQPGTFTPLTVANPNATVNFQVNVVGGHRVIIPDGLAHQPKSFAFKPGDLPPGKFPRLERGGDDKVEPVYFNLLHDNFPRSPPIQTRFIFSRDPKNSADGALGFVAKSGPEAMSEFADLYQFLWFVAFFAGVGGLFFMSARAVSRAEA